MNGDMSNLLLLLQRVCAQGAPWFWMQAAFIIR
jgi:hypothetical protein